MNESIEVLDMEEKEVFTCSKCGAIIDPDSAEYEEFDDSLQCPVCGSWE